jgi:hypothetical protein
MESKTRVVLRLVGLAFVLFAGVSVIFPKFLIERNILVLLTLAVALALVCWHLWQPKA